MWHMVQRIIVYGICVCMALGVRVSSDSCLVHDVCSCKMNGKDKDMVTLRPLDLSSSVRFVLNEENEKYLVHYNPCTPFTQPKYCHETLACQYLKDGGEQYTYGLADPRTHQVLMENGHVVFHYSYPGQDSIKRNFKVALICDRSAEEPKTTAVKESAETIDKQITYSFNLTTKCACPGVCSSEAKPKDKGLSVGSILLILLFVLLLVYFVGGFLFLKFYRKEEGLGVVPHREFWTDLPAKITEGCAFTWKNIRKKDGEYEQI